MSKMTIAVGTLWMLLVASAWAAGPHVTYDPEAGGVRVIAKSEVGEVQSRMEVAARGPREVVAASNLLTATVSTERSLGQPASQFLVTARGTQQVHDVSGNVTGVLFQATAQPDATLRFLPIRLSYQLQGEHDAVLNVTIGSHQAASEAPAWVWATAARFAAHPATGALTLMDQPQTSAEQAFHRVWRQRNAGRLVWARYHPVLDDTLMGFYLLATDAMIADAEHVRTMVNGLNRVEKVYGYPDSVNRAQSLRSAKMLDGLMKLESQPGDYAMFNDLDAAYRFSIVDGKLQLRGTADYHFARPTPEGPQALPALTSMIAKNRHLFAESSPPLYNTVEDFGRLAAFFNHVEEVDPTGFKTFVASLEPVLSRMPRMETPIAVELSR